MGKKRDYGQYFSKANHIGLRILVEGVLYLAEMYFRNVLNVFLDFELKSFSDLRSTRNRLRMGKSCLEQNDVLRG